MVKKFSVVLLAAVVIAVTSCAPLSTEPFAEPMPEETQSPVEAADNSTDQDVDDFVPAERSVLGMCEVLGEGEGEIFLEYPGYYVSAEQTITLDVQNKYLDWADRMTASAPQSAASTVAKFVDPIRQVQAAIDDGSGDPAYAVDDVRSGSLEILELCVDEGYKIGQ